MLPVGKPSRFVTHGKAILCAFTMIKDYNNYNIQTCAFLQLIVVFLGGYIRQVIQLFPKRDL
jgi:hypothetical protein